MRTAWLRVDLDRLTLRLWKTQGKWVTGFELRQWLSDHGYQRGGGPWYFCTGTPCDLEPDEILESRIRITEDNITFVDHPDPSGADPSNQSSPPA